MTKQKAPNQLQEIYYNGYRYRSRLDARWAAFFDAMNIRFDYMPQEFTLQDGSRFAPNFKLYGITGRGAENSNFLWAAVTDICNWTEEKYRKEFYTKVGQFCQGNAYGHIINPIIILPLFPDELNDWLGNMITTFAYVDGDTSTCVIAKSEEEPYCREFMLCSDDSGYIEDWQFELTEEALERARSAHLIPWEEMKKW